MRRPTRGPSSGIARSRRLLDVVGTLAVFDKIGNKGGRRGGDNGGGQNGGGDGPPPPGARSGPVAARTASR